MSLTVPEQVVIERTVEAYSRNDPNGTPYFNTCQLVVGDGTVKIEFEKGRADVPVSLAQVIAANPHIHVPGLSAGVTPVQGAPVDAALQAENETLRLRLADMEAMLKRLAEMKAAPVAEAAAAVDPEATPDGVVKTGVALPAEEIDPKVLAAMEYLAQEGEDVPEPGSALPAPSTIDAIEALTTDGQARCQAVKADGSQCSNPALGDTGACAIARHQVKAPE
jgi:hypothetical protein